MRMRQQRAKHPMHRGTLARRWSRSCSCRRKELGGWNTGLLLIKELDLNYHNTDIQQIVWFLDHGNLIEVPKQQPRFSPTGSHPLTMVS